MGIHRSSTLDVVSSRGAAIPQAQAVTAEISRNQETSLDVVAPGKAGKLFKKKKSGSSHVIWVYSTLKISHYINQFLAEQRLVDV